MNTESSQAEELTGLSDSLATQIAELEAAAKHDRDESHYLYAKSFYLHALRDYQRAKERGDKKEIISAKARLLSYRADYRAKKVERLRRLHGDVTGTSEPNTTPPPVGWDGFRNTIQTF